MSHYTNRPMARVAPWRKWSRYEKYQFAMHSFGAGFACGFVFFAILWVVAK